MFSKKLFEVKWLGDFSHATVNHSAAVIARTAKGAADKAKQFYNLGATKVVTATEKGETYLHTSEINLVPGAAIAKGAK